MAKIAPQQHLTSGKALITYLPDGEYYTPPEVAFPTTTAADWQPYRHLLQSDGRIVGNVGVHVIQTDSQTILVDTGNGPRIIDNEKFYLSGGELLQSLARAGLAPEDIDIVFYTHLHVDHVGWTGHEVNGTRTLTFPRARYLVRSAEWHKFDSPTMSRTWVEETLQLLTPRIEFIEDDQFLVPGVRVVATPGHTPGHAALSLESPGERVLLMGDVYHSLVELEHPEWLTTVDEDPQQAIQTRRHLLQELAVPGTIGSGIHFPDSAFGRLVPGEDGILRWKALQ